MDTIWLLMLVLLVIVLAAVTGTALGHIASRKSHATKWDRMSKEWLDLPLATNYLEHSEYCKQMAEWLRLPWYQALFTDKPKMPTISK